MSDRLFFILGCLASCLLAATVTVTVLYMSDRSTEKATNEAHTTVVENQKHLRILEGQVADLREELKVCIEKGARK